jgi:hypothetical protein
LFAFGAVRFCVARSHESDGMHREFNLSRINADFFWVYPGLSNI